MTVPPFTLMGIVNVTPDSFSDGGRFTQAEAAIDHALQLVTDGAHILDIGGESTRPGADYVPADQEIDRVIPVIEALRARTETPISIDTRKPEVAREAVAAGAEIWNDVSALTFSPQSVAAAAMLGVTVVLMHAQGTPDSMQDNPRYENPAQEVCAYLAARRDACVEAGIAARRIILDPGIGFGKSLEHNVALFRHLDAIAALGQPVLMGASRKRFIAALDRDTPAEERVGGSIAAVLAAAARGATWFRVHDVAETRQALSVAQALHSF